LARASRLPSKYSPVLPSNSGAVASAHDGVGAVFHAAHRRIAALDHHVGVHEGGRVQTIDGDALVLQLRGEIEGEHHLRQLALPIRARALIVARQHQVVEIDRMLPGRRNVHDPRRRAAAQGRQQSCVSRKPDR